MTDDLAETIAALLLGNAVNMREQTRRLQAIERKQHEIAEIQRQIMVLLGVGRAPGVAANAVNGGVRKC